MSNTITPSKSAILGVVKQMKATEKTDKMDIDPNDAALYQLTEMPGWKLVSDYIDRRIESLSDINDIEKLDLASIGMRFVMIETVKGELKGIISLVENSSKFVEEQE